MAYQVRWTENSVEDLAHLIQFLQREWSSQSAEKFIEKVFYKIEIIKDLPNIGKQSEKMPNIRRILITKQSSIYYSLKDEVITILNIFDNRQDPKKSIF